MILSFRNVGGILDRIDYFEWFMQSISSIYEILDLPTTSKGLNSYKTAHDFIHASCDTKFNNWNEDPMVTDACIGSVYRFKQEGLPFIVKLLVVSHKTELGDIDRGMFKIEDEDPNLDAWVAALASITKNPTVGISEIHYCSKTCGILNEYWNKEENTLK
jgi:hypothetical protein